MATIKRLAQDMRTFWAIVIRGEQPQPAKINQTLPSWAESLQEIQSL